MLSEPLKPTVVKVRLMEPKIQEVIPGKAWLVEVDEADRDRMRAALGDLIVAESPSNFKAGRYVFTLDQKPPADLS